MLEEDNVRTGFFEEHQRQALLGMLPAGLEPLAGFLSLTGWRLGEALGLEWPRVDFAAGVIRLEPGTTKNSEGGPSASRGCPSWRPSWRSSGQSHAHWNTRRGRIIAHVFHLDGEPIWPKRFYRAWWETAKAAEVYREWTAPLTENTRRGPIPHVFRRTVVRNLERAGVPRSVAMKLTGHRTEAVYRRYAIVSEADLAEGVSKLAALPNRTVSSIAGRREKRRNGYLRDLLEPAVGLEPTTYRLRSALGRTEQTPVDPNGQESDFAPWE
jgi:integrase